jgi:hypothetical protein
MEVEISTVLHAVHYEAYTAEEHEHFLKQLRHSNLNVRTLKAVVTLLDRMAYS